MPFARPKISADLKPEAPIAAGIVFVAKDGDVLLLRRAADEKNYGGHWGLPGGGGEAGETAVDAAIRECREEIQHGLDAETHGLKVMDRVDTPNGMQFTTFAKGTDDKFVPTLDSEHTGYCWASLDMLPQPLHPQVARVLGTYIGAADGMTAEDWDGLRTGLADWARSEQAEDADFEESDHPRGEGGKFTTGAGGNMSAEQHREAEAHHKGEHERNVLAGIEKKPGAGMLAVKHFHASNHHASAASHLDEGNQAKAQNSRGLADLSENEVAEHGGVAKPKKPEPDAPKGWKKANSADLAAQGLKPKKRGNGASVTETAQVAWSHAISTGKPAVAAIGAYGWKILTGSQKPLLGQPYMEVQPDGKTQMFKYDLDSWGTSDDGKIEIPHKETIVRPKDFFAGMPGRGANDARLAMDRRLYDAKGKRIMGHDVMALDRAPSSRTYDADGHLHLTRTPISKANICEYWGHEIPDADKLGLDPQKLYRLLRDPEELAKAASSSNGKQLMLGHVPVSADDPKKDVQVGSTGTDAEFDGTYLYNSLHLHDRAGIDAIEKADRGEQASDEENPDKGAKELSSAYRYRADMTPGTFKGEPYDGVMRDIDFNHVALVPEGRAGADVVVGDSKLSEKEMIMSKKVLSRFAGASAVAMGMYLQPRLAKDAKLDLTPLFADVTKKNFASKKEKLGADIKTAAGKLGLAKDANLDDMHDFMDRLDKADLAEGADEDPNSGLPMSKEDMEKKAKDEAEEADKKKAADRKSARDAFLKEKGMDEADIEAMDALCEDEPGEEAEKDADGEEKKGKGAKDKGAKDKVKGMDAAAVAKVVKTEGDRIRAEMRDTAQAYADVEPYVGKLALGMDSAADVYRTALKGLGQDAAAVDAMHVDALKPVLLAQPKPGEKKVTVANDAALGDSTGFASRWGQTAGRISA